MTVDAAGEVVSVAVTEPRFTPGEVAVLLESRRAERVPRGSHGLTIAEATDPANAYRFYAPEPITDYAQMAVEKAKDAWRKKWGDEAEMGARLFRVEYRD